MFTSDWFSTAIPGIRRTLAGRSPPKTILEIGSWEGRSACWFLEQFPEAVITCVDTFRGSIEHEDMDVAGVKDRFLKNTERYADRVVIRQGRSSCVLYGLDPESFDLVYVDGSHQGPDVMMDLALAYGLLKPGGVMLVDDVNGPFPGVTQAVNAFATVMPLRCVLNEYQVHFVKPT
jgi:predicted O-methyltransferase YrrM